VVSATGVEVLVVAEGRGIFGAPFACDAGCVGFAVDDAGVSTEPRSVEPWGWLEGE